MPRKRRHRSEKPAHRNEEQPPLAATREGRAATKTQHSPKQVKHEGVIAAQLCPTLRDLMGCSPPGSSVHGILQTRTREWVAISSSYTYIHTHTHIYVYIYMHINGLPWWLRQ